MHSDLVISQADRRPMYLQIVEQIRRRIAVGDWPPGYELPSIRTLAAASRVSVITVKRAYSDLERDGVIVTRQGKGSCVAETAQSAMNLQQEQLEGHLVAAVELAEVLGLDHDALRERLRGAWARRNHDS